MKILLSFIDLLGLIFECFVVIIFFNMNLKAKSLPLFRKILLVLAYFVIMSLGLYISFIRPYLLVISLLSTYILTFFYHGKTCIKILYTLVIFSLLVASEILIGLFLSYIKNFDISYIQESIILYLCGVIFSKFIIFVVLKVILMIKSTKENSIRFNKIIPLIMIAITSSYIICLLSYVSLLHNSQFISLLTSLGVLMLLLSNVFIIYFIDKIVTVTSLQQKLYFSQNQLKIQTEYYNKIILDQIRIAKIKHDMNNAFISLLGYFNTNDYAKAKEKIESLNNSLSLSQDVITCTNPCLAAILNVKYENARKDNINFNYVIGLSYEILIDNVDFCMILGNAIDNAIEACRPIKDTKRKNIVLKISDQENYISIFIENSIDLMPEHINKKKDKLLHGYGQININTLCEKYGGNAIFEKSDESYKTYIILKNEKK